MSSTCGGYDEHDLKISGEARTSCPRQTLTRSKWFAFEKVRFIQVQMDLILTENFKETSKRGKTHQREKIKHKVTETRKKAKKEAKKNPQWKSSAFQVWVERKHMANLCYNLEQKKDPGIPNNFPYKDRVLAEIAEERRKVRHKRMFVQQ